MDLQELSPPRRPRLKEVEGFVRKCASYGLSEEEAAALLQRASLDMQSPAFKEGFFKRATDLIPR